MLGRFADDPDDRGETSAVERVDDTAGWYVAAYEAGRSAGAAGQLASLGVDGIPRPAAPAALELVRAGIRVLSPSVIERQRVLGPTVWRGAKGCRRAWRWINRSVPAFPGYLFVRAPTEDELARVSRARHVEGVLRGASEYPVTVPPWLMAEWLGPPKAPPAGPLFPRGAALFVREGPLQSLSGTFDRMDGDDRIILLLDILGAQRAVSVASESVELK